MNKAFGLSLLIKKAVSPDKSKSGIELESLVKIIGVMIAVVTLVLSYQTYRDGEKWKKADFSVVQFRKFQDNPSVQLVNQILDYDRRLLPLMKKDSLTLVDERMIERALIVDSAKSSFDPREVRVREVFDEYFDELGLFNRYYETGVVDSAVLRTHLAYQIRLFADPNHKRKSEILSALQKRIWTYLDYYEFRDVQQLCRTFHYNVTLGKYPPIK